jgi:hypothetical protein
MLFPKRGSMGFAATHYAFRTRIHARKAVLQKNQKVFVFGKTAWGSFFAFSPPILRNIGGEAADALGRNCGRGDDGQARFK